MHRLPVSITVLCWFLLMWFCVQQTRAQGVEVSAKLLVHSSAVSDKKNHAAARAGDVVVWLSPLKPIPASSASSGSQTTYRLVQKDKMFTPHLLVVPTGTSVQFPNEDPFFHNVFSLFNGKRFDLGLYESGMTRSVRFDREGVSYIFCNIHPEMGAVVLSLSTPYYAISTQNGSISIHNVPPGSYQLNIWSENSQPTDQALSEKIIQVSSEPLRLGDITLQPTSDALAHHKNKFDEDYQPSRTASY